VNWSSAPGKSHNRNLAFAGGLARNTPEMRLVRFLSVIACYQQLPHQQTMNYTFDSAGYSQTHTIEEFLEFGALDGGLPAYRLGHN
jgi:hypothetical protein